MDSIKMIVSLENRTEPNANDVLGETDSSSVVTEENGEESYSKGVTNENYNMDATL